MRWFKHMTDASDDGWLNRLEAELGIEAYARWWKLLEVIAREMDESDGCGASFRPGFWVRALRFRSANDCRSFLERLANDQRIFAEWSANEWSIKCPKLLKIRARKNAIGNTSCTLEVDGRGRSRKEPPIVPQKGDDPFDLFWKKYPRKVGKAAARRSWSRLKLNSNLSKILEAVDLQQTSEQWKKDGGQFIPHPATWLNQGRWEDEPTEDPLRAWARREDAKEALG